MKNLQKNLSKNNNFIRQNLPFYLLGFLLIFGIKYFYSKAGSDDLKWILAPTAGWVEFLSRIPFIYEKGTGYVNHSLRLLIAPSCSGVQFMLITIATLLFSFLHRVGNVCAANTSRSGSPQPTKPAAFSRLRPALWKLLWTAATLLLSWLLTIFVNGLRIIAAIYLPVYFEKSSFLQNLFTPEKLHTTIGIVVYFISLLTIYRLTEYAFAKSGKASGKMRPPFLRKCVPPVFWYFLIVLGIPLLNKAYQKSGSQFTGFVLLVSACCSVILLLYALLFILLKHSRHKSKTPPAG